MPHPQTPSISPIKLLNNPSSNSKPYQTPAKYLTQRNDTIYQEEYYKEKSERLQKHVRELRDEIRILQTQNKELKTQIQLYREAATQAKGVGRGGNGSDMPTIKVTSASQNRRETDLETDEIERLLKEIRILKNNHQLQLTTAKNQTKRLSKTLLQLQDQLHNNQTSWQTKCQQSEIKIQEKNKQLEKEIKEMRKSVVVYMEERDENVGRIERLRRELEEKEREVEGLREKEVKWEEERVEWEERLREREREREREEVGQKGEEKKEGLNDREGDNWRMQSSQRASRKRQELYEFGVNSIRRNPTATHESQFSIHTFNGTLHIPAQEALQATQSLRTQIHRLQTELQRQSITHTKDIGDLNFRIQRCQKQLKEKDNDIVNLLTKVKPLMLVKEKMTKENVSPQKKKRTQSDFQEERENAGKNAFGLKMLDLFLRKYKMETF